MSEKMQSSRTDFPHQKKGSSRGGLHNPPPPADFTRDEVPPPSTSAYEDPQPLTMEEDTCACPEASSPDFARDEKEHPLVALCINEPPFLRAFRQGVMQVMPLLFAAALALLINNFPLQAYQDFMLAQFGPGWKNFGRLLYTGTVEILALAACFSLSGRLIARYNERHPEDAVMPSLGAVTAFACLITTMNPNAADGTLTLQWAGIHGLFGSLVITFCACWLFLALYRIKALRIRYAEDAENLLPGLFNALLPILATLCIFALLQKLLSLVGVSSMHSMFYEAMRAPFQDMEDSFGLGALYAFLVQVCWFFGIHGADLLDPITHQLLYKGMEANSLAINHNLPPPHIFTKYFFDVYLYMGGSGTTLGLLVAIFLRSRDNATRYMGAISALPGLFNINELLIFGLPIVFNPVLLLPFLLTPLVLLLISYAAVTTGLAPVPVFQVDWTTPPFINAFISTDSWRGVALQFVNLCVATLIYLPFVSLVDKAKETGRKKAFNELSRLAASSIGNPSRALCRIDREGSTKTLALSLAKDLANSLNRRDSNLALLYQPRIDFVHKTVPCVEALLRWTHPLYGGISPALTLAIADDAKLSLKLNNYVFQMAFAQQRHWRNEGVMTNMALNLSEEQLRDPGFPDFLRSLFVHYSLPRDAFLLEVREVLALDPEARYLPALETLHNLDISIAVDDFGRGYQAISHIKRLPLSELQIDRALVRNVTTSASSQRVIGAIQELCFSLGVKTSAEHVENLEQLEALLELNFSSFQGFYFSEPVSADACKEFMYSFNTQKSGEAAAPSAPPQDPPSTE